MLCDNKQKFTVYFGDFFNKANAAAAASDSLLGTVLCPIFCTNEIVGVAQLLKGSVFLYQGQN